MRQSWVWNWPLVGGHGARLWWIRDGILMSFERLLVVESRSSPLALWKLCWGHVSSGYRRTSTIFSFARCSIDRVVGTARLSTDLSQVLDLNLIEIPMPEQNLVNQMLHF